MIRNSKTNYKLKIKKTKAKIEKQDRLLAIGYLDLDLVLDLSELEAHVMNINYEDVSSVDNLINLIELRPNLIENIILKSKDKVINSLLYLNKIQNKKIPVDFISLESIKYENEQVKELLMKILKYNHITQVSEGILNYKSKSKVNFTINYSRREKIVFQIASKCNDDNESTNLCEKIDYKSYSFLLYNIDDFWLDRKYSKSENTIHLSEEILKILTTHPSLKVISLFPNILKNTSNLSVETLQCVLELICYSDLIFAEKKDAFFYFKLIEEIRGNQPPHNSTKNNFDFLEKLFMEIKNNDSKHKSYKIGVFIDELTDIYIFKKDKSNNLDFRSHQKLEIVPRVNHSNVYAVEEYKRKLAFNYDELEGIFIGGFLSYFFSNKSHLNCISAGEEITRKILELIKTGTELFVSRDFYMVNIDTKTVREKEKGEIHKISESKFILDCVNPSQSRLKRYNPYSDESSTSFFNSNSVIKHLREIGFIDKSGKLSDPIEEKKCRSRLNRVKPQSFYINNKEISNTAFLYNQHIYLRDKNYKIDSFDNSANLSQYLENSSGNNILNTSTSKDIKKEIKLPLIRPLNINYEGKLKKMIEIQKLSY